MTTVVSMKELVKKYEDRIVVNGVNLEIMQGEFFGILGPKGAGKSTLLKMIYGGTEISFGELYVHNLNARKNFRETKSLLGIVPQKNGLDVDFSVRDNLLLYGSYFGIDSSVVRHRTEDLLRLMRLEDYQDLNIRELNSDFQRRVALARGLINIPKILILDEPTEGLDPQARQWMWNFLKRLKEEVKTALIATHYVEEIDQICDRIALMDRGEILTIGRPKELVEEHIGAQVVEVEVNINDINYYGNRLGQNGYSYQILGKRLSIYLKNPRDSKEVLTMVVGKTTTVREPTLSDVFFKLAGHDLREEPL